MRFIATDAETDAISVGTAFQPIIAAQTLQRDQKNRKSTSTIIALVKAVGKAAGFRE